MPYIAIKTTEQRLAEVERYRYGWVQARPFVDWDTEGNRVVVWECEDAVRAQGQVDRLSSGLIAARLCETFEDVEAVVAEWGFKG